MRQHLVEARRKGLADMMRAGTGQTPRVLGTANQNGGTLVRDLPEPAQLQGKGG